MNTHLHLFQTCTKNLAVSTSSYVCMSSNSFYMIFTYSAFFTYVTRFHKGDFIHVRWLALQQYIHLLLLNSTVYFYSDLFWACRSSQILRQSVYGSGGSLYIQPLNWKSAHSLLILAIVHSAVFVVIRVQEDLG